MGGRGLAGLMPQVNTQVMLEDGVRTQAKLGVAVSSSTSPLAYPSPGVQPMCGLVKSVANPGNQFLTRLRHHLPFEIVNLCLSNANTCKVNEFLCSLLVH